MFKLCKGIYVLCIVQHRNHCHIKQAYLTIVDLQLIDMDVEQLTLAFRQLTQKNYITTAGFDVLQSLDQCTATSGHHCIVTRRLTYSDTSGCEHIFTFSSLDMILIIVVFQTFLEAKNCWGSKYKNCPSEKMKFFKYYYHNKIICIILEHKERVWNLETPLYTNINIHIITNIS